jgi:hypothetical protein
MEQGGRETRPVQPGRQNRQSGHWLRQQPIPKLKKNSG